MAISEGALIAKIRRAAARRSGAVQLGIGDDCAILRTRPGWELLVTTDFTLEDVHFRREWHSAEVVGHRCLVRGLSDIAAMGGEPIAAFLSLALPKGTGQTWIDGFLRGFMKLARRYEVTLAGGDVAQSPHGVLADVVVLGEVRRGKAVRRSGAKVGDVIYVTGSLGGAAAVLDDLRAGRKPQSAAARAHFHPEPRLAIAPRLRGLATAMIDISDGLSTDLSHICEESGVGAVVDEAAVPAARTLAYALHGGDDYELLFTVPAARSVPANLAGVPLTRIGEIVPGRKLWLRDPQGRRHVLPPRGWQHFAR